MSYFPMFIDLKDMNCLIVGGGKVALRKVRVLCDFGAVIKVIGKEICEEIKEISRLSNMQSPQEMYLLLDKMNDLWRQMALEKREL